MPKPKPDTVAVYQGQVVAVQKAEVFGGASDGFAGVIVSLKDWNHPLMLSDENAMDLRDALAAIYGPGDYKDG